MFTISIYNFLFLISCFLICEQSRGEGELKKTENGKINELFREAVENNRKEIVEDLIKKGANINAVDSTGFTPLMEALIYSYLDIAKILIDQGADINYSHTLNGLTSLHIASQLGQKDIVLKLLEKGADINAKMKMTNKPPIVLAAVHSHWDIVNLLIDFGADVNSFKAENFFRLLVEEDQLQIISKLLNKREFYEFLQYQRCPFLYVAAEKGNLDLVRLLIANGADGDSMNQKRDARALYAAAKNGHKSVVKELIEHGANVNLPSADGMTPIYEAASNKHWDIVKLLLREKADTRIYTHLFRTNEDSKTGSRFQVINDPFRDLIEENKQTDILKMLDATATASTYAYDDDEEPW